MPPLPTTTSPSPSLSAGSLPRKPEGFGQHQAQTARAVTPSLRAVLTEAPPMRAIPPPGHCILCVVDARVGSMRWGKSSKILFVMLGGS